MKLYIDFLRGKMFYTHFPALFNSKHYAEVRNKRTFFLFSPIMSASQAKVFKTAQLNLLLYSEFSEYCCLSSKFICNTFNTSAEVG